MTRLEAIEAIKCNWPDSRYTILREALDMAISALRQQDHFREVTKKVEPLTLDELRQMDGEPVWVCFSKEIFREDGWFIITETGKCEVILNGKVSVYKSFDYYGKTWLAYRQKPEEDKHEP